MKQARRKERRKAGRRKGQFFILGAVLVCSLFFVGLPLYGPQIQSYREDLSLVSNNLESEFPRALNLALKSGSVEGLADFSGFSQSSLAGHNTRMRALWVVSEPQGSGVWVTVGNFMNQSESVSVTVEGNRHDFNVPNNSTLSWAYPSAPDDFQISVQFQGHEKATTWVRDKVGVYAFMEFSRGADTVVQEIEA